MSGTREFGPETVSELTARLKRSLEEAFPDVLVIGEVSSLNRAGSGHFYLTLKDQGAALSSVIWRSTAKRVRFEITEGMEVLARGRINLYPPRGQYQLDIRDLRPGGLGALQLALEELRTKLEAEGLFDPERKKPLPRFPRRIGVVTSADGAAIRDILKVIRRRYPRVAVVLRPTLVQGEGAAEMIAQAIRDLSERGGLDVLIVGRGGGSLEDLWAFNEEPVARAIAASAIPVVSAVGHEVDVTISDLVADVRAPTPSSAAEIVVPDEREVRSVLSALGTRVKTAVAGRIRLRGSKLAELSGSYGLHRFPDRLKETAQRLDEAGGQLAHQVLAVLSRAREALAGLSGRAEALSPLEVLARGYSVTVPEGGTRPVKDAAKVEVGARIRTRLKRGELVSRVEERILEGGESDG